MFSPRKRREEERGPKSWPPVVWAASGWDGLWLRWSPVSLPTLPGRPSLHRISVKTYVIHIQGTWNITIPYFLVSFKMMRPSPFVGWSSALSQITWLRDRTATDHRRQQSPEHRGEGSSAWLACGDAEHTRGGSLVKVVHAHPWKHQGFSSVLFCFSLWISLPSHLPLL